ASAVRPRRRAQQTLRAVSGLGDFRKPGGNLRLREPCGKLPHGDERALSAVHGPGSAGVSPASRAGQKPALLEKWDHPECTSPCHRTRDGVHSCYAYSQHTWALLLSGEVAMGWSLCNGVLS